MSVGQPFQFPKELEPDRKRIKRLAWLSIIGLASAAAFLGLTVGQSQTMKTAWGLHWRLHDLNVVPVSRLDNQTPPRVG